MNPGGTGLAVVKHEIQGKKGQPGLKIWWTQLVDWKTAPLQPEILPAVLKQKFGDDGEYLRKERKNRNSK